MKPGEQKPHWAPPYVIQACCSGCRCCGVPMPSMVMISLNSATRFIFLVQARTTSPFRITEQAPQTPVPQPILTPVSPIRRRTTARVSSSGSHVTNLLTPLMLKLSLASLMLSSLCLDAE